MTSRRDTRAGGNGALRLMPFGADGGGPSSSTPTPALWNVAPQTPDPQPNLPHGLSDEHLNYAMGGTNPVT